jgi:hypothetical protein
MIDAQLFFQAQTLHFSGCSVSVVTSMSSVSSCTSNRTQPLHLHQNYWNWIFRLKRLWVLFCSRGRQKWNDLHSLTFGKFTKSYVQKLPTKRCFAQFLISHLSNGICACLKVQPSGRLFENQQEYSSPISCGNFVEYFTGHQLLKGSLSSRVI